MKQKTSSGAQCEVPRRSWELWHQQHWGPENQDSQHKLNQPRGSFSEHRGTDIPRRRPWVWKISGWVFVPCFGVPRRRRSWMRRTSPWPSAASCRRHWKDPIFSCTTSSRLTGSALIASRLASMWAPLRSTWLLNRKPNCQGKKKTHKHKQICGIVPGLGGCQKCVYVFFFFSGHSLWGDKTHKQNSPQNPGTIPWKFCLRVFFFMCFLLPKLVWQTDKKGETSLLTVVFLLAVCWGAY